MALTHKQRITTMTRLKNVVPVPVQDLAHEGAHTILIFNEQYRLAATTCRLLRTSRGNFSGRVHGRQIDFKCRSDSHFGIHPDVTAALLDDSINRREPETGAFADFFRREERFEDA